MNLNNNIIKPLEYTGHSLKILDQRLLPSQEIYLEFTEADEIIKAFVQIGLSQDHHFAKKIMANI